MAHAGLAPYADAVAWIDGNFSSLGPERVSVGAAGGRVLAQDVVAPADVPAGDRALADGWALSAEATTGAGAYNPLVVAAFRAAAGAALPAGMDAVVPEALAQPQPDGTGIEIIEPVVSGAVIERRGEDFRRGTVLLPPGHRLRPADLGLVAGAGLAELRVVRRPRVHLVAAAAPVAAMLRALVERDGGVIDAGAAAADLLLVAGAAPTPPPSFEINGVALRPGGATRLGHRGATPLLLLPGIPAQCLWAYEMLAGRALRRLAGLPASLPYRVGHLAAAKKLVSAVGFVDIWPVRRVAADGVEPVAGAAPDGAGLFATVAQADGFVVMPAASEGCPAGTAVAVYLYQGRDG